MKLTLMKVGNNAFTIIESLIFLAVTAAMVFIGLQQLNGRTDDVRYNDSVAQLEVFVDRQISLVNQGADLSGSEDTSNCSSAQNGGCLYVGRVLEFENDSDEVTIHTVFGNLLDGGELSRTLEAAEPMSVRTDVSSLDWQLRFIGAPVGVGGAGSAPQAESGGDSLFFGFFRLPQSTEVFPILFAGDEVSNAINNPNNYRTGSGGSDIGRDINAGLCFSGINGQEALLIIGGGNGSNSISIDRSFDENECNAITELPV